MKRTFSVTRMLTSGILEKARGLPRHKTQEDVAAEVRKILKTENTWLDISSDDYPSVKAYRETARKTFGSIAALYALNDLIGGFGLECAETARGGEWLEFVNMEDSYAATFVYFRGVFSLCSLGDYIETSRVKFK